MSIHPQTKPQSQHARSKARLLIELFGQDGMERLKRAGLEADLSSALAVENKGDSATDAFSPSAQASLLSRFREKGLLNPKSDTAPAPRQPRQQSHPKKPQHIAKPESLTQRILDHIDEAHLGEEHPAVVAMILRKQPKSVQTQVLKALPSAHALVVLRYLRAGKTGG